MRFISLDISMSTGYAIFEGSSLVEYGKIVEKDVTLSADDCHYPYNFLLMARAISSRIIDIIKKKDIDHIVIEETNKGRDRYAQKKLEFLHCCLAMDLFSYGYPVERIDYISTSTWRKTIDLKLKPEHRELNNEIRSLRRKKRDEVVAEITKRYEPEFQRLTEGLTKKKDIKKVSKQIDKECKREAGKIMSKFRVRINGKAVSEVNTKNLSVDHANKNYSLNLKIGDNDIADAICLADAFIKIKKVV